MIKFHASVHCVVYGSLSLIFSALHNCKIAPFPCRDPSFVDTCRLVLSLVVLLPPFATNYKPKRSPLQFRAVVFPDRLLLFSDYYVRFMNRTTLTYYNTAGFSRCKSRLCIECGSVWRHQNTPTHIQSTVHVHSVEQRAQAYGDYFDVLFLLAFDFIVTIFHFFHRHVCIVGAFALCNEH